MCGRAVVHGFAGEIKVSPCFATRRCLLFENLINLYFELAIYLYLSTLVGFQYTYGFFLPSVIFVNHVVCHIYNKTLYSYLSLLQDFDLNAKVFSHSEKITLLFEKK